VSCRGIHREWYWVGIVIISASDDDGMFPGTPPIASDQGNRVGTGV